MISLLWVLSAGAVVSALSSTFTRAMRPAAVAFGVVDQPGGRKQHDRTTPLLGGVAIYLAMAFVGIPVALVWGLNELLLALLLAAMMTTLGLIDDYRALHPLLKLVGQLLPIALALRFGLRLELTGHVAVDSSLTFLMLLATTNAINLLDNMNGLASGLVTISAAALGLMGAMAGSLAVVLLSVLLIGACLGFLPFNFPTASIFMGDAGSMTLGFLLGIMAVLVDRSTPGPMPLILIIVLLLPAADTCAVIATRSMRGLNPFTTPGHDHISHHFARRLGGSVAAVTACWAISALAGLIGTLLFLTL
jgi:UDP-GlcNAc:undecaprenyl-phosphate/decaprenyl-phosphate GlcNAc-1-phosphate transferase